MIKSGKLRFWTFLLMSIAIGSAAAAKPIQVTGSVDRNEMSVGDTFTYTIEISSEQSINVEEPRLASLEGFDLLNKWSGVESRSTFANGTFEVVQSRSFNYMLAAQRPGSFTIQPATVVVEGQAYRTQPIKVKVLEGRSAPPQAQQQQRDTFEDVEDVFNQLLRRRFGGTRTQPVNPDEAFFIQVEVDKNKAYVGEQVTATWYLYTRGQIHDIDTLKYPSLNGFWKEEIELATRLNFQQEVVNGIVYQRAVLASYALFPIKAGDVTVDSYKAKCTVTVPAGFGFSRPYQFTKASKPVVIQVVDVPKENRPANYTGAVGQFTAQAAVPQTNVVAHQPLSYKVRFEGRGNAKLLDLPALNLPAGIELYDTKNEAKFFREGNSYKEFELVMIPRQAGALTIPAIEMSAFNPQGNQFYTVATQPIVLNVLPGVAPQSIASAAVDSLTPSEPKKNREPQLPPLNLQIPAQHWPSAIPLWSAWTLLYVLVLSTLAWRFASVGEYFVRRRDLNKMAQSRLVVVKSCVQKGDWRGVGTHGTNLIYLLLGELAGTGGAGQELEKLWQAAPPSVRRELTEPVTKVLQVLELLSFAPENLVGAKKDGKNLNAVVKDLEAITQKAVKLIGQIDKTASEGSQV